MLRVRSRPRTGRPASPSPLSASLAPPSSGMSCAVSNMPRHFYTTLSHCCASTDARLLFCARSLISVDVRLLQRVPYEGISRMQTSLRRRHRDRVVRRGIGMTIESDVSVTLLCPPWLSPFFCQSCADIHFTLLARSSTPPRPAASTSRTSSRYARLRLKRLDVCPISELYLTIIHIHVFCFVFAEHPLLRAGDLQL